MDSGFTISSEMSRHHLRNVGSRPYLPPLHSSIFRTSSRTYGDRFIPNRAAMDMDIFQGLLTEARRDDNENNPLASPSKQAYKKLLAETILQGRTRILSFRNKPQERAELLPDIPSPTHVRPAKPRRHIPQRAEATLDAPEILDDYYLNLLDWGSANVLSVALGDTVYLLNATNGSTSELVTVHDDYAPVTSVSWAPDGCKLAIGLNSSDVQLWDSTSNKLIRTLRGIHQSRVGSLAWNESILTTGGMDGAIVNNDIRARPHAISSYRAHNHEVCGLKWSGSGKHLASGGSDNLLHIWSLSTSNPLHRFANHTSAVKALAWCPVESNLLASGGGVNDQCIKLWNVNTGTCLNSLDTGSQVSGLLWNNNGRELLSSHGFSKNELTLWKYPSMVKMAELTGHTSRVLFMAQSPDRCTVASAAADETLRLWNVFGVPEVKKPAAKTQHSFGPTNIYSHIR